MNYQNIKVISSLIAKNYYKLIFVSKYLFQQIRMNNSYLKFIYGNIKSNRTKYNVIILKYLIDLYRELLSLNHKFSNAIFNTLHNINYRSKFINLDLVKDLYELRLINKYNFCEVVENYGIDIIGYLISVDFYDKDDLLSNLCRSGNLKLFKIIVEELHVEVTFENSILHCCVATNINFIKYMFLKLSKRKVDFQGMIRYYLCNESESPVFIYMMEEMKIKIEKSTIKKIINEIDALTVINLIQNNYITLDRDLFLVAIKSHDPILIRYLCHNFNFLKEDKNIKTD